ncbi:MAG: PorP/SprF family type IX secretion system membrane protein [Bacteroidota bacterium]
MKKSLLWFLITFLLTANLNAQELPVFSQKFNNGLIYNPSQAGLHSGAVDISYQRQWSGLDRSINNLYAGLQNHFADGRIGITANVFREKFNLLSTNFISAGAAYHLPFGNNSGLSMGVSVEYANINLDLNNVNISQENDPLIQNFPGYNHIDFGFGFTLSLQHFQIGASSVRFAQFLNTEDAVEKDYFPAMISGFSSYRFLLADENSWLEPRIHYRLVDNQLNILDVGLYFTYNNLITAGASYRNNATISGSVGVHLQDFTIAYSRQTLSNEFSSDLGGSDEITLRYTFNENLNFFGTGSSRYRGRLGGGLGRGRDSNSKLMDRRVDRPRNRLNKNKERRKLRNYKGKYKKLLRNSRN